MKVHHLLAAAVLVSGSLVSAQEARKVPDNSARVVLQGCTNGRTFIVGPRREDQPGTLSIQPGRRFRLNGPKKVLEAIESGEGRMVEVTGLIRKADIEERGIGLAGGRVRVGGADPRAPVGGNPVRDSAYNQAVMDVESSRPLPEACRL